jgi:hypothetical protein
VPERGRASPGGGAGSVQGRVVVLGEAAMITAQIDDGGAAMGMNVPGNDNEAFARNLFHWLWRGR